LPSTVDDKVRLRQVQRHREGARRIERQEHALGGAPAALIGRALLGARRPCRQRHADDGDADAGERARRARADDGSPTKAK